jgi:hypothetical protein
MEKEIFESIVKAPHYFLVHFIESFVLLNGYDCSQPFPRCKPYIIICDNVAKHVYGFTSEDEAREFDSTKLRSYIAGSRERNEYWEAEDEQTLMQKINDDERVKNRVYVLHDKARHGAIENLPECPRMHVDRTGYLHCGKPENEYGDGCRGGCVLKGYHQEEDMPDGKCPMHVYWNNLFTQAKK